jgi:hypothetical protein
LVMLPDNRLLTRAALFRHRAATVRECPWACGPPKVMKTRATGVVESIICGASSTERLVVIP